MCDECAGQRCGGKFAPFFCANVTCLQVSAATLWYSFLFVNCDLNNTDVLRYECLEYFYIFPRHLPPCAAEVRMGSNRALFVFFPGFLFYSSSVWVRWITNFATVTLREYVSSLKRKYCNDIQWLPYWRLGKSDSTQMEAPRSQITNVCVILKIFFRTTKNIISPIFVFMYYCSITANTVGVLYIRALVENFINHWSRKEQNVRVLFSFVGVNRDKI